MEQDTNFDYKSYCENILAFMKSAPVNLFFKDTECKYRFVTRHCNMVYGDDHSILGKTDLDVQVYKEFGRLYYEDDKKIIATGIGSHYVNEIPTPEGVRYFEIKKNPVFLNGKVVGIVGTADETTPRVRMEKELEQLSYRDTLTGLYNRNYFDRKGQEFLDQAAFPVTAIMSDCNYLKRVNDTYGHEYGDLMLKRVARILRENLAEENIVIRVGGDEFLMLCQNCTAPQAAVLVQQLERRLAAESDDRLPLSVAFGAYTMEHAPVSLRLAYHEADHIMYQSKHKNR
mgnify:CR=1 FL=1